MSLESFKVFVRNKPILVDYVKKDEIIKNAVTSYKIEKIEEMNNGWYKVKFGFGLAI